MQVARQSPDTRVGTFKEIMVEFIKIYCSIVAFCSLLTGCHYFLVGKISVPSFSFIQKTQGFCPLFIFLEGKVERIFALISARETSSVLIQFCFGCMVYWKLFLCSNVSPHYQVFLIFCLLQSCYGRGYEVYITFDCKYFSKNIGHVFQ